ncbi:hypothetical protein CDD83_8154 [Cordyceps sp. RAO-2017]|nr:hypothetical protein CDD83_8154 [Cordyceps sp. RAO-2017]
MKTAAALLLALGALAAASPVAKPDGNTDVGTGPLITVELERHANTTKAIKIIDGSCPENKSPWPWGMGTSGEKVKKGEGDQVTVATFKTFCMHSVKVEQPFSTIRLRIVGDQKCPKGTAPMPWREGMLPQTSGDTNPKVPTFTTFCLSV